MTIQYPGRGDPSAMAAALRALADDIERMTMFQPTSLLEGAPILEDWGVAMRAVPALTGDVIGHPILGCRNVISSEVYAIDTNRGWARTYSRFYRLGKAARQQENK